MIIVETHAHPIAADTRKYPIQPLGGVQSEWSKDFSNTADEFLALMDEAGVAQATLVQASTVHGYDNSYTADCAAAHPDRFVGIGCIDALASNAPDVLSYWIAERGLKGIRLFTTGSTLPESNWLDSRQVDPFWERARQLRIPVNVQIRYTGIPMLMNVIERYPDITYVVDHLAGPALEDGPPYAAAADLLALSRYPTVYLKFSTMNLQAAAKGRATVKSFFETLINRFGANRIEWASNYPAVKPFKNAVDLALRELAFLPEAEQAWLLGGTARELYPDLKKGLPG